MVITRITKRKNRPHLYSVYIDGAIAFDVSDSVLVTCGLRTGDSLSTEKIATIKAAESTKEAQHTAINYVSYRPRSSREVLEHLKRKGFSKDLAESVVRHFQSVSLINDLEFARMFVRDKIRRKHSGKSLLQKLLAGKGITPSMIDTVLREYITDDDQKSAAQELASKRLRLTKRSM